MKKIRVIQILLLMLAGQAAHAELTQIQESELAGTYGSGGISIIVNSDATYDLVLEKTKDDSDINDHGKLLLSQVGGELTMEKPLKIDIIETEQPSKATGDNIFALQVTLPGTISTNGKDGYSLGKAVLSMDNKYGVDSSDSSELNKSEDVVLNEITLTMPPEIADKNRAITTNQLNSHSANSHTVPRASLSMSGKVIVFAPE